MSLDITKYRLSDGRIATITSWHSNGMPATGTVETLVQWDQDGLAAGDHNLDVVEAVRPAGKAR